MDKYKLGITSTNKNIILSFDAEYYKKFNISELKESIKTCETIYKKLGEEYLDVEQHTFYKKLSVFKIFILDILSYQIENKIEEIAQTNFELLKKVIYGE